ncbi:ferric reductase like transmembrane component-domain-containing protein [Aspergillus venezuelensis]
MQARHMDMHMDMEPTGLPWLDSPVMLHSSRADNCTLTPEQCVYRRGHWRYWYQADNVYALNTVYFLCATIGVFTIFHFAGRYAPNRLRQNSIWQKTTAASRYLAYRGVRIPVLGYWAASLGMVILLAIGAIFFFAMMLGPRPYYWPNTDEVSYGGSPPIATRSGWMAVALLPFVLVLGTKANLITALTGVPHERLQVYHHWTSYAMFVLALVHTFPFIVYNISQGSMMSEWRTSVFYWTGVAALICQTYLTFMSLPAIRNRYYEFFKSTHILIALLFILFFFFHCDFRLTSWDYFIAAGTLYIASLTTSLIRTHLINGRHSATLSLLPSGLLQIRVPTITSWTPGQHVFIRFIDPRTGIALHSLTSHPFTICSVAHDIRGTGMANEMVFYVKPKGGITRRLAKLAQRNPGKRHNVLLEGPYGGIDMKNLERSNEVVIVSGGSGGGFALGVFEAVLSQALRRQEVSGVEKGRNIRVKAIFATHIVEVARWYASEIERLTGLYCAEDLDIDVSIHVTSRSAAAADTNLAADIEKETQTSTGPELKTASASEQPHDMEQLSESSSSGAPVNSATNNFETFNQGRPNLPTLISNIATSVPASDSQSSKRAAIFVCGPASMLHDVRSAAAKEQERILKGGNGQGEVYLHSESFS